MASAAAAAAAVVAAAANGAASRPAVAASSTPTSTSLWRECAEWLERCKVLRADAYASPDAQVAHFAHNLRDGVLLCHLLTRLQPDSIDFKDVCLRPQMAQCMCLKNIRTFLQACRRHFDLKETDLFDPQMLYDYSDFGRVLHTLSKLSKCPKAVASGRDGFPASNHRPPVDEKEVYKKLEDVDQSTAPSDGCGAAAPATPRPLLPMAAAAPKTAAASLASATSVTLPSTAFDDDMYEDLCSQNNEELYEDLCSVQRRETIFQPQSLACAAASSASLASAASLALLGDRREHAVRELVETEQNYLNVLSTIRSCYLKPMSAVINDDERKCIFFGIEKLHELHTGFHADLVRARHGSGVGPRLHSVCLAWKDKLLLYGDICSNLPTAQRLIDVVCCRNPVAAEELRRCQEAATATGRFKCHRPFALKDLLTMPFQRILKYHILLDQLRKHTPESHEDYAGLVEAHEAMRDVAAYVNEYKKDNEMLQIIGDVQDSISGWPATGVGFLGLGGSNGGSNNGVGGSNGVGGGCHNGDGAFQPLREFGRLIKDGELKMRSHEEGSRHKLRYVFIFNRAVIFCKTNRGEPYSFRTCLLLDNYKLEDKTVGRSGEAGRWNHQWLLADKQNSMAITLYAKSLDAKNKWMRAFSIAMESLDPVEGRNTEHSYALHTFVKAATCDLCKRLFKGAFFQGYRCAKCGVSAHKECLQRLPRTCGAPLPPPRPVPMPPPLPTASSILSSSSVSSSAVTSSSSAATAAAAAAGHLMPAGLLHQVHHGHHPHTVFHHQHQQQLLMELEAEPWFAGEISRTVAESVLRHTPPGTFLLRRKEMGYVISLKTGDEMKHMRCHTRYGGGGGIVDAGAPSTPNGVHAATVAAAESFFLQETYAFRSLAELVHHYRHKSLSEAFGPGLDAYLERPWKWLFHTARAVGDYQATDTNSQMLSIRRGQHIVVVSREGDSTGWWKGRFGDEEGYFPKDYVEEDHFYQG